MREPTVHSGELLPHGQDAENSNVAALRFFNVEALLAELLPEAMTGADGLSNRERIQRAKTFRKISVLFNLAEGLEYRRIKAACAHGEFLALLQEEGVSRYDVQRAMQALDFAEQLDRPALEALLPLDLTKFRLVATLPVDEARQLAAGQPVRGLTFEDIRELPSRACEERIKSYAATADAQVRRLQAELKNSSTDLEIAESTIERLERQLQIQPRARARLPASVVRAREESAALGTQALAALDDFAVLIETIHEGADLDADAMKAGAQRGAAASNLFLHLIAVRARAELLLARMQLLFSAADLPASPEATWPLDEDEAQRILAAREQFLIEHRAATVARAQRRIDDGTVKRGRGRPKKQG